MIEILTPQINANEDTYTVQELCCEEGASCGKGQKIAVISSSKSVMEVFADGDGLIHFLHKPYEDVKVNEPFALLFVAEEEYSDYVRREAGERKAQTPAPGGWTLTKKAREYAEANHITDEELAAAGKKLIKQGDLEKIVSERRDRAQEDTFEKLSANQRGVARTVAQSHAQVPQAFLVMKADAEKSLELIRQMTSKLGVVAGWGEILTVALIELFDEFPDVYASFAEPDGIRGAKEAAVGVTLDAGKGLFVPVVKASGIKTFEDCAEILFDYKRRAMAGSFETEDLAGGNLSISLNPGGGVLAVLPIVMPGQTMMVSVGGTIEELALDDAGQIIKKRYVNLTFAYDHRVVNGYRVMQFARALADKLESGEYTHPLMEEQG